MNFTTWNVLRSVCFIEYELLQHGSPFLQAGVFAPQTSLRRSSGGVNSCFSCCAGPMMTQRLRGKSPRCLKLLTRSSGSLLKVWTGRRRKCVLEQMFVPVLPSLMSLLQTNGATQLLNVAPPSQISSRITQLRRGFCRRNRNRWKKKCLN